MKTDPVCRMKVMEEKALSFEYRGTTYYFCANGCLERFRKDPEKYLAPGDVDWIRDA